MDLDSYLIEEESTTSTVAAYDDPNASSENKEGTLACTPYRLVYVRGDKVTDISLNDIGSIEYTSPSYPEKFLWYGIIGLLGGFVLLLGRTITLLQLFSEALLVFGVLFLFVGLLMLFQGYITQRATLKVHTSNKTYEFESSNNELVEIGHTVRGHEMENQS